jgi:hypothetical protein
VRLSGRHFYAAAPSPVVLDILLDGGRDKLGVIDETVPIDVLVPQHRVNQEGQLGILVNLWLAVVVIIMRFTLLVLCFV